ncbi:2-oxoglutarate dehydrogenase complex dihydrolipoyllysine-residue succinyltransferase [Pelagibius litoralis]|uniref:Dihydrolipoyllysine-residue succinyltransferase n=1 Tax=Pelagibius litoralis TaxID=374515 RepID=A0A967CBD1_9PROT|nr:2-oxoglutarate dehydrogenase complex dihydrolipoyllysine-residue succinyltransferase [Pelagibius litoralis]NIA68263.1 2-oxoglutarate dehydrogenase complex dihydrolipoyllysine-residue succinyltransferase [Pelagibius litoralis]
MATDIVVPTLGESVSEATVAQWLKKPGEAVAVDDPLVELETDKVTLEVNATAAGVLAEVIAGEGDNVEVGAVLGRIGEGEGSVAAAPPAASPAPAPATPDPPAAAPVSAPAPAGNGKTMEIVVPTLGESVTEATVAQWLKKAGDAVGADEGLVELETDKVTLEVNAPAAGSLQSIAAEEGATVEVGALLAVFSAGGAGASAAPAAAPATAPAPAAGPAAAPSVQAAAPAPSAAPVALDPAAAARTGGKITKADLEAFLTESAVGKLGPAVRKLVEENKLDPAVIPASGKDGRLTKEDVVDFLEGKTQPIPGAIPSPVSAPASSPAAAPAQAPAAAGPREERVRMPKLRQTIARRLKEAQNTAAMLTTFNEADMSAVMALRAQYKDGFEKKHGVKLGFSSFFTKACVAALQELPAVNARIDGDEIVYNKFYDIGMAVSTPNGLMVPVMRDCDKLGFAEIEKSLGELAAKGRDGKLSMDEMTGGTFTITNGGVFGSMMSTPILNMPQSAILGLHKIQQRPMAVNGQVEIRPMMYLALSYDHRIIDGREAVTFLVRVKEAIEDPQRLLIGM